AYAPSLSVSLQQALRGDELFGQEGNDWLYGNLRSELLVGGSGSDYLHGDYLAGPDYADNFRAQIDGGGDTLYGEGGEDELHGGGGDDKLFGGADSDWIGGGDGSDQMYGGSGIDILVLDVAPAFQPTGDVIDGHFGNSAAGDTPDDNATDILLV